MGSRKILLTGATGYIGGSILTQLVETGITAKHSVSVLVRGEDKAKTLESKAGVKAILFQSLDEVDLLQHVASEHDIVIHTASGFHTTSAKALVLGLGDRKRTTGNEVHYIHTTGTSNLGDQPITGKYHESRIFSDNDNIYSYLKDREAKQVYAQRTTDLVAIDTGLAAKVPTTLLMSPTIYGIGSGLFNKLSIQVPTVIRAGLKYGQVDIIGEGNGVWDYVHISDLTKLYEIVLNRVLNGEKVPTGEKGILFTGTGRFQWKDLSKGVADALYEIGAVKKSEVKKVTLDEAAPRLSGGLELHAELGYASNSRTLSDIGHEFGWKEEKTERDFKNHFLEEAKMIVGAALLN